MPISIPFSFLAATIIKIGVITLYLGYYTLTMKGILLVAKTDLIARPELFETLRGQSERVAKANEGIRFHSRDGTLMAMICALLDHEVLYKLEFETSTVSKGTDDNEAG